MHLSTLLFISGATALGINCRGSGWCFVGNAGASLNAVREQVGVLIAQGGGGRRYASGRE